MQINPIGKQNNPSFGLHNPKAAMFRAQNLKTLYAQKGINYVLPNEVLSDGKIAKIVDTVDFKVKSAMEANKKITPQLINRELNKFIPDKKINSRDISGLRTILKSPDNTDEAIERFIKSVDGVQADIGKNGKVGIFLRFNDINNPNATADEKLYFRSSLAHELTQALHQKYQNILNSADYHYSQMQEKVFDKNFFDKFDFKSMLPNVAAYDLYIKKGKGLWDNMLKKSIEKHVNPTAKVENNILEGFDKNLKKIVKNDYSFYIKDNFDTKQFYNYCKARARNEKFAQSCKRILMENKGEKNTQATREYFTALYSEMEKFFAQKAKNAKSVTEINKV